MFSTARRHQKKLQISQNANNEKSREKLLQKINCTAVNVKQANT